MTSYLDHVIVTPNDSSATGVNVWRQDQGGVLELRRYVDLSFLILFIGVANFLAVPHLARIFLVGACCADDAYFAVIARRLAETGQYGFPTSDSATTMFDPLIGSGPVHIAAGALGILLLGPSRWVPSLVTMVHFGTLLAIYLWILRRRFTNAIFYGTALVLTAIATASYHGYFSLFVGEAPMLGYLVLGTACLAMWRPAADRWLVAGGLALSFALLTKPIALFPTLGILAAWLLIAIVAR